MKKSLTVILIFVLMLATLSVGCFVGNGQIAYADAISGTDEFGLKEELGAKAFEDYYGEGLSLSVDGTQVLLYVFSDTDGKPIGVRLKGFYFGASDIEVVADVYSSDAFAIDFKINAKKNELNAKQLDNRNALIDMFARISVMMAEVDQCANTTYDGANGSKLSDIYKYNVAVHGDTVEISPYTYAMLGYAREMYLATGGAFNPAVYRLVDLWGFSSRIYGNGNFSETYDRKVSAAEFISNGYPLPEQKFIEAFSDPSFTDFSENAVKLSENDGKYFVTKNVAPAVVDGEKFEQWIDLGGIAKGYAVDLARAMIKELGIDRFYVNAGSSSIATGYEYDGGNTALGMVDAFNPLSSFLPTPLLSVDIGKASVSTSGQNVRKYTVDGVEYAHILDGATGVPAQTGVKSVMVVVPEELGAFWATMGDCLTTALTVMGRDKIVEFANGYLKEMGIKFIVQYETLDGRKQLLSNFSQDELTPIDDTFSEYGWAMKLDDDGNYYYDADAKFSNPKQTYTVLLAVLGSILGAGAVALVVYHFVRGKKRVTANVLNAKKDKPFKVLDVMLYLGVLLVVLVLLVVFVFDVDRTQLQTVTVIDDENGEILFVCNVMRNEYVINEDNSNGWVIEVNTDDGIVVTLTREIGGEQHFNKLKITRGQNASVEMIDSRCGFHQDCVRNFPAVTRSGSAIVCSPNRLKIVTA
ncbi:MAG: FAD:protein FMN transferase [Clostridiales bacterium]|nr:FAD:protein FMN transferase [Clostridiales bacterium]